MSELLVRAWQPKNDIQDIGDIVSVKPDGWRWGKCECLPDYLVVKLPGVAVSTVTRFLEALSTPPVFDADGKCTSPKIVHKRRKFAAPAAWINSKVALGQTVVELKAAALRDQLINGVTEKRI